MLAKAARVVRAAQRSDIAASVVAGWLRQVPWLRLMPGGAWCNHYSTHQPSRCALRASQCERTEIGVRGRRVLFDPCGMRAVRPGRHVTLLSSTLSCACGAEQHNIT